MKNAFGFFRVMIGNKQSRQCPSGNKDWKDQCQYIQVSFVWLFQTLPAWPYISARLDWAQLCRPLFLPLLSPALLPISNITWFQIAFMISELGFTYQDGNPGCFVLFIEVKSLFCIGIRPSSISHQTEERNSVQRAFTFPAASLKAACLNWCLVILLCEMEKKNIRIGIIQFGRTSL